MPTLVHLGNSFDCATAIKGDNYIHLLNDAGVMIAAFDNITDFSGYSLENGAYTSPTADHDCYVAVIRDDGTIGKGGHTCADIGAAKSSQATVTIGTAWIGDAAPYTQSFSLEGVTATCPIEIMLPSTATAEQVKAFQKLALQDGGQAEGSFTLRAFGTVNTIEIPVNVIIRRDL